jgi:hypothetical protein
VLAAVMTLTLHCTRNVTSFVCARSAYSTWDKCACVQQLLAIVSGMRIMWPLLLDWQALGHTWHLFLELALSAVTSLAILVLRRW